MDRKRDIFAQIITHWGTPEIDLFATRLNAQLPKFLGNLTQPHVLWMHLQLVGIHCIFYAFLPFCQIQRCLQKIMEEQVHQGITTLPFWPTQVWWPQLLKMLVAIQFLLPKQEDLLSLSRSPQTLHPLRRKLTMLACLLSGISEAAAKLIMASWRDGTKKQYSTYIKKWQTFCNQRQISHIQPSVVSVLHFRTLLYQQVLHTVSYITLVKGTCVGQHPLVSRLMKGIFQEKPPRPKYTEILLVSGQRGQTVYMLSLDHMVSVNNCYTFSDC